VREYREDKQNCSFQNSRQWPTTFRSTHSFYLHRVSHHSTGCRLTVVCKSPIRTLHVIDLAPQHLTLTSGRFSLPTLLPYENARETSTWYTTHTHTAFCLSRGGPSQRPSAVLPVPLLLSFRTCVQIIVVLLLFAYMKERAAVNAGIHDGFREVSCCICYARSNKTARLKKSLSGPEG